MFKRNRSELSLGDKYKVKMHKKMCMYLHILSILSTASVDNWFI
jgi:hypothetical protein